MGFDSDTFRSCFSSIVNSGITYLDSAATSLKPDIMANAINEYYINSGATVHRSMHAAGKQATAQYETSRIYCAKFINSQSPNNIIWTKGSTDSINMVAYGYVYNLLQEGDEIIINDAEHHSNIVPWIMVAKLKKAKIVRLPLCENGYCDTSKLIHYISSKTKFIAITQMSNVTGKITNIDSVVATAHKYGVKLLIDGAQGVVHQPIDVQSSGVDFYVFSAHKLYGPSGIGVLYYSPSVESEFMPVYGGGQMIADLDNDNLYFKKPPYTYEAGTPNIAGVIGFGVSLKWYATHNIDEINRYTECLSLTLYESLKSTIPDLRIYSTKGSNIISFNVDGIHHVDVTTLLSERGFSIRSGKHCAIPLMKHFGVNGTLRASIAPYNTEAEITAFASAATEVFNILR